MSRLSRLRTLAALGPTNLVRVGLYRAGLRFGVHPVQRVSATVAAGPFFGPPPPRADLPEPNRSWDRKLRWYDWKEVAHDGSPPDWFADPFAPGARVETSAPWWQIPDFGTGDIKNVWELSRFGWLLPMATEAAAGESAALDRLNRWLASWAAENPPYRGPNWKCGQEASIRVMHLVVAAIVLGQGDAPLPGLVSLVDAHVRRIAPTLSYARGQQNNHGTSEAAAMFVGGDFLAASGVAEGRKWREQGRLLLEERAEALIAPDGSFSQHSVTYHRVMLDAYCLAEAWRRRRGLPAFAAPCLDRLRAATDWLEAMTERETGDAPNLGANDGARLLPLTDGDYRDFRPTLQLASTLFRGTRAIEPVGRWDDPARWLGVAPAVGAGPTPKSRTFDDGGYHVLRSGPAVAVLRYPRFRFRPSQADALHLDLWLGGRNLLRDGGTFSYNDPDGVGEFLAGTGAHNTVQFDGRDQMPRFGRFLFGEWLRAREVEPVRTAEDGVAAAAGYRDWQGAEHHRHVRLGDAGFTCIDRLDGAFGSAILRWRLEPGTYELEGNRLVGEHLELSVAAAEANPAIALTSAPESRYYQHESDVPCLEVRVDRPCRIVTEAKFRSSSRPASG